MTTPDLADLQARLEGLPPARQLIARRLLAERGIDVDDFGPFLVAGEPDAVTVKQEQLWQLHASGEADEFYHVGILLELRPDLELPKLLRAWQAVAEQYDVLRTGYRLAGGQVRAMVPAEPPEGFGDLVVLNARHRADAIGMARAAAAEFGRQPLRLDQAPVRTIVLDARPHAYFLGVIAHDMACDSYGLRTVMVPALDRACLPRSPAGAGQPALRLRDVAAWQRRSLIDGSVGRQVAHRREFLRTLHPVPVQAQTCRDGERIPLAVTGQASERAVRRAHDRGASVTVLVLAAWASAIAAVLGTKSVMIGSCASGRHRPQLVGVLGNLANTLLIDLDVAGPAGPAGPAGLMARAAAQLTAALSDADAPFELVAAGLAGQALVADELACARLTIHSPGDEPRPDRGSVILGIHEVDFGLAKSALSLEILAGGAGGLAGYLDYRPAAVSAAVAGRLAGQFCQAVSDLGT